MAKSAIGYIGSDSGADNRVDGNLSEIEHVDTTATADAEPVRKSGWPKGKPRAGNSGESGRTGSGSTTGAGKTGTKEKAQALDLSGISAALVGIHMGVAALSKHPHWQLEEPEADAIAKSVANVARHYPKVAASQKLVDWAMLIQTIGFLYVPRIIMSKDLVDVKRKNQNV